MAIESADYISQLVITNPTGSDSRSTSDDHHRLIKKSVKQTFPNLSSEVSASSGEMNTLVGVTANLQTQLNDTNSAVLVLSNTLETRIASLSATYEADVRALSATLNTAVTTLSATMDNEIRTLSDTLKTDINTKLNLSATAVNTVYWEGGRKFISALTASGSAVNNSVWFQYE